MAQLLRTRFVKKLSHTDQDGPRFDPLVCAELADLGQGGIKGAAIGLSTLGKGGLVKSAKGSRS